MDLRDLRLLAEPRLGPRVPVTQPLGRMETIANIAMPHRVVEPRSAATTTSSSATASSSCGPNPCETGVTQNTYKIAIILGVVIPVVAAIVLFVVLQRRHSRKQREEDSKYQNADLDFGLGHVPQSGRAKKPAGIVTETSMEDYGEKGGRQRQVSMDLAMNSPYLLPPELQQSRESLHSLSRTIHQHEDPYNPINKYYAGDDQSMRSRTGNEGSSTYTGSSKAPSRLQELSISSELLANASSMPRSAPSTPNFVPPPRQNSLPQKSASNSPVEMPANSQLLTAPYPTEPQQAHIQDNSITRKGLPTSPRPGQTLAPAPSPNDRESVQSIGDAGFRASNNYLGAFINGQEPSPNNPPSPPPSTALPTTPRMSPPVANTLPANPRPARKESLPAVQQAHTSMDNESQYGDGFQVTPPSPTLNNSELMRGQRYSMDVPPEEFANAGLGAPGFDARRLSMGFRPLPPNAITETDDPEIRANRIRSFYKEYFDDSKPAPAGQYYEDYDQNYLTKEVPYPVPQNNGFVMPFAEPVGRRAMTPPPRGTPRFQGQEGQSRGRQGSMGAMSMSGMSQGGRNQGGGMRGPPGPPQMYPPGPYPQNPSQAYSSASGRSGASKRPLAPPAALSTLPTPSKLKEDSGLFDITDFAPPPTYRDRVAGRSESPLGERRPYSPAVPAFVPTYSAYDELAPMPSPHLLRRSGTFTALDFAPPKKFRDPDAMSDAGSIRSNRSGISQTAQFSIRNGANRVSRLPADMVFSKDDMAASLKPQWGMRQGM